MSGLWNHHSRGLGRGQREWDQGPCVHLRVASGDLGYSRVSPLPFSPFYRDNYRFICGYKKQFEIALVHRAHVPSVIAHSARAVDAWEGGHQSAEGQVPRELR